MRRRTEHGGESSDSTKVGNRLSQLSVDLVWSEFDFLLRYNHVGFGGLGARNTELHVRVNSNRCSRGDERLCRTQNVPGKKQKYKA